MLEQEEMQQAQQQEQEEQEQPRPPIGMPYANERLGGEAPFVAWWHVYRATEDGVEDISITVRAGDAEMLLHRVEVLGQMLSERGYLPTRPKPTVEAPAPQPQPQPSTPATSQSLQTPAPPPPPATAGNRLPAGTTITRVEVMEVRVAKNGQRYLRLKTPRGWASAWPDAFKGIVDPAKMQEGVQYRPLDEYPFVAMKKDRTGRYWNVVTFLRPDEANIH